VVDNNQDEKTLRCTNSAPRVIKRCVEIECMRIGISCEVAAAGRTAKQQVCALWREFDAELRDAAPATLTSEWAGVVNMALYYLKKIRWLLQDIWTRYIERLSFLSRFLLCILFCSFFALIICNYVFHNLSRSKLRDGDILSKNQHLML